MEYKLSDPSLLSQVDSYSSTLDNVYYRNRSSFNGRRGKGIAQTETVKKKATKKRHAR